MSTNAITESHSVHRVVADDGIVIGARVYGSPQQSAGVVLIHGAMAVPQRFYRPFAQHLAAQDFCVVSYDYRGVGESRPMALAGFEATARDWAEHDARAMIAFARSLAPDPPLLSVGHSFGGQLTGLIDEAREVRGAVMVGAQLGYYKNFSPVMQARLLGSFGVILPLVSGLWGYAPGRLGLGEDLPKGVAREWAKWCLSPGYLRDHVPGSSRRFARFDRPVLLYSFTDDEYAPKPTVDALIWALSSAAVTHRRFAPSELGASAVGHFGFFRPERQDLWQETARYFRAQLGLAPARLSERNAYSLDLDPADIMQDLSYGRA